jgi:uncharacterized 2Fe-2S/4Fe-4S cluster protein (DUF4445 family)
MSFGISLDIGTSNITSVLINLNNNKILKKVIHKNPQKTYGSDILSRLTKAKENQKIRKKLHELIINKIQIIILNLTKNNKILKKNITKISVVGNSAMICFFLNLDPSIVGNKKKDKKLKKIRKIKVNDFGFKVNNKCELLIFPILGSYIGSDVLADIIETNMFKNIELNMLLDVGTNIEIIIGNKNKIFIGSVPGGPAFEESHLSFGSSAVNGAIYKVKYNNISNKFKIKFFGKIPKTICGSGIIDAVAELKNYDFINKSGKILTNKKDVEIYENIKISQKDIRNFQLVKSAICTGVNILLKSYRKEINEIDNLYITGTFGKFLNKENLKFLKFIPNINNKKIKIIEDGAVKGGAKLLNMEKHKLMEIIKRIKHIELPLQPGFQQNFIENMSF